MTNSCNSTGRRYNYGNGKTVKECIKKNEYVKRIRKKIVEEKLNSLDLDIKKA